MVLVLFYGSIENGSGAHKNPRIKTTINILFLFLDRGEISSSGRASLLLKSNIKINNAINQYPKTTKLFIVRNKVVLPEPLGPKITANSPCLSSSEISLSARVPSGKVLDRFSILRMY